MYYIVTAPFFHSTLIDILAQEIYAQSIKRYTRVNQAELLYTLPAPAHNIINMAWRDMRLETPHIPFNYHREMPHTDIAVYPIKHAHSINFDLLWFYHEFPAHSCDVIAHAFQCFALVLGQLHVSQMSVKERLRIWGNGPIPNHTKLILYVYFLGYSVCWK